MDRLYFITHTNEKYSYFESACLALDCGIKLIQLRMKHAEEDLFRKTALQTLKECEKYGARLILNDNYRLAKELGYSEPDPRIDLSGKDVIRKLVILTREAGFKIEQDDVEKRLFVPDKYFKGSLEEFWQNIPQLDAEFEKMRQSAEKEGKRWRFVATMENGKGKVALQAVSAEHPFYNLADSNNIVMLTTERYKEYPMLIQGYGAGAVVTAAGVFADILSII